MKLEPGMFCLATKENFDNLIKCGVKASCLGYDLASGENYLLIVQGNPLRLYNRTIVELIEGIDTEIQFVDGAWKKQGYAFLKYKEFLRKINEKNDCIFDNF